MARTETTAAVLLRSVAYGDADRIVTLLTEARGKVALMARGARKSKKRFAGALEPYALIEAEIALGRGDVGRLAQARVVRAFPGLLTSLEKIGVAAACLEVVRETVADHDEPDARLVPSVVRLLEVLEGLEPDQIAPLHLGFVLRWLALTGHSPNFTHCGRCSRAAPEGKAALFDPQLGAIVCRACGGGPTKVGGALREAMLQASTRRWDTPDARLTPDGAAAIDAFLAHHLPRRLAGADLVSQVRAVSRGTER